MFVKCCKTASELFIFNILHNKTGVKNKSSARHFRHMERDTSNMEVGVKCTKCDNFLLSNHVI